MMSQLRHDPIQRRWVIIAEERKKRAGDFAACKTENKSNRKCPFCPGNESMTPPEIASVANGDTSGTASWKIRVVPNRFPALDTHIPDLGRMGEGIYDRMNGVGAHEVIIEGPEHDQTMGDYSLDKFYDILCMYRERLVDLMKDNRLRYVLIFKNHGEAAGATLIHPHSQVIATPITPRTVSIELQSCRDHYRLKERCLICDIIQQEVESGERIIYDDGAYIVYAPYASRFPFELFVAPRQHSCSFGNATDEDLRMLSGCMKNIFTRLRIALNDPPFNFVIHTSPNSSAKPVRPGYWATLEYDYHWHIEIIPRLTKLAGFEWGTGFYINPTTPEDAAQTLREISTDGIP